MKLVSFSFYMESNMAFLILLYLMQSYYLIFSNSKFDYLHDNSKVMGQFENISCNLDWILMKRRYKRIRVLYSKTLNEKINHDIIRLYVRKN